MNRYAVGIGLVSYYNGSNGELLINDLKPDTEYTYYVQGWHSSSSDYTEKALFSFRTKSSMFPMWAAEASGTVIDLHWDGGDIGITLEVDGQKVGDFDASKKSHRFTGLNPDQTYKFRGRLDFSDVWVECDVKTVRKQPIAPTFLEAYDQTSNQVSLYWNNGVVDGGSLRYKIERDGQLLDVKDRPPYTDTTPQQGRSHVYSVQTMDDQFNLSEKIFVTVCFEDFTAPTDPANLSTSHLTLTLQWDESYDSSGQVFYDIDQDGNYLGTTKEIEFSITGLDSGQRYTFGVRAKDPSGNESNRVTVTYPPVGIPFKHQQ